MTLPKLTVAFFTYTPTKEHQRHHYAERCLHELLQGLVYDGDLAIHIADDGSPPEHRDALQEIARRYQRGPVTVSNSERRGYGASYNAMTNAVHGFPDELVLSVEDDWALMRQFDVSALCSAFEADKRINCIRLNYLGFAGELRGTVIRPVAGQGFLLLDPFSPEYHVWSAGPRIETVHFQRSLGLFREHCIAGEMEIDVAGRSVSRHGICWPLDAGVNSSLDNPSTFAHIGTVSVKDDQPV